jgi:hypothetical protein
MFEDYLRDAIAMVDAWEVPEEDFAQAVNDQARMMAGMQLEVSRFTDDASPYSPLQF